MSRKIGIVFKCILFEGSRVLGNVIDIWEAEPSAYRCLGRHSIDESELDDVPNVAPHSKLNDGDNYGATQVKNQC